MVTKTSDGVTASLRALPSWWVGELDRALERGDYEAAAQADRELLRLGYCGSGKPNLTHPTSES